MTRCTWAEGNELMQEYHDQEWGVPVHDDQRHFEFLILEGAQAGLSWLTVLNKREGYRNAFSNFDPNIVAGYTEDDVERLVLDSSIIRNRAKIRSASLNARAFIAIQHEFGSFDRYVWRFVNDQPIVANIETLAEIPAKTPESEALSKDLLKRGFKFVGSTICYAYMQAVGLVDDHMTNCFRVNQEAEASLSSL